MSARTHSNKKQYYWLILGVVGILIPAVIALISIISANVYVETRSRGILNEHWQKVGQILSQTDSPAALSILPLRLQAAFVHEKSLSIKIQGALGQVLYDKGQAIQNEEGQIIKAAAISPVPLEKIKYQNQTWLAGAQIMQIPINGAAPLTVTIALQIEQDQDYINRLAIALLIMLSIFYIMWLSLIIWIKSKIKP